MKGAFSDMHAGSRLHPLRHLAVVPVALAIGLAACQPSGSPSGTGSPDITTSVPMPSLPASGSPSATDAPVTITTLTAIPPAESLPSYGVEVVVEEAKYPVTLAAAPDGRIFYSELATGQIRILGNDLTLDEVPWANVNADFDIEWAPDAPGRTHHGGLTAIAFDPDFTENGFVYVVTQVPGEDMTPAQSLVVRYREQDGRGVEPTVLLELRAARLDNIYSLVFGPDGMLYVPAGHCCRRPEGADPLDDTLGKILRIRPDGTAPGDNPFGDAAPLVWAQGVRNAYDIAFVPGTPHILAGENGAEGHDEINLIMRGHDYGWPAHEGATGAEGITQPLLDYGGEDVRIAPTGITHYDGELFPELRGRFLMCQVHEPGLYALQLQPEDPGHLASFTQIARECSLDVVATPSGEILFSDRYTIYRLVPAS